MEEKPSKESGGKISQAISGKTSPGIGGKGVVKGHCPGVKNENVLVPHLNLETLKNLDVANDELSDASTLDGRPNVSACICVLISSCVHVCVYVCVCIYIYIYIYIYTWTWRLLMMSICVLCV